MFPLFLLLAAIGGIAVSWFLDRGRTRAALSLAARSGLGLLPPLLALVALVGLTISAVPASAIGELFQAHGTVGFFLLAVSGRC
ncbi:MAG TPA: hypothetical protein PKU70_13455 [Vicinamibacteria bacterium]|nr:hypothetical protein [Vicinamibacteria bacterium]